MDTATTISTLSRGTMSVAAVMLALLLLQRYRRSGGRHLRLWASGWAGLAVYQGLNAAGPFYVSGDPSSPARLLISIVANGAVYSAGIFWIAGGARLSRAGQPTRRGITQLLVVALLAAVVMAVTTAALGPYARYFMRVGLSTLWMGASLVYTAVLIRRAARRHGLETTFLSATAALFGCLYLFYFLAVSTFVVWDVNIGYMRYFGPVDLLLSFAVGMGMLLWQLEEDRQVAIEATEALRASEERLRQSQKMEVIGRLAGGIAHDFNNVLTVILGYSGMLAEPGASESDVREAAGQILRASERASTLTNRLLAFAKRQVVRPSQFDLNEAVREVTSVATSLVDERVRVRTELHDEPLIVEMDAGQLQQVFLNLIINARDAMPSGGELILRTWRQSADGQAQCGAVVEDTGHGIDAEMLDSVCEPFFTTKGELGTGLGLPTALSIVEEVGGRMHIDSAVGEGTRVTITLPLALEVDLDLIPAARPSRVPSHAGARVLLVEDDDGVRAITRRLLIDEGYVVEAAADGEAGLERLSSSPFDILLTDVILPGMTGVELVERARVRAPELPALLITGYAATATEQLRAAGYDVVRKPFTRQELLAGLARAFQGLIHQS